MKRQQMFAMVSDQGTAMLETAMTAEEFADQELRLKYELIGLASSDCSRVDWRDVTDNDAFFE